MSTPRIMYYTDARHPLTYMYEPPMLKEEFESSIDELVGTPVEAVMFCLGDGRTMQHDTKVGELWGHNVDRWSHIIFKRAYDNVKALIDEGLDPLRIACERAHAKGLLLYPTLLVQLESGVRGGPGYDIRSSDFRFDNKHLEIGARGDVGQDFPGAHCADFKHQEVRDERFALIEEAVTRYPVDGFELQLNFWPYYFHPDEIEPGRAIMTDWVRRVHEAVKGSGADRELVITIPASLDDCLSRGLDPQEWLRMGIVDVLVGQPIKRPEVIDPNASFIAYYPRFLRDLRGLVDAARGTGCRVHASLDDTLDSDRLGHAPIEMVRAAACSCWDQGIDGLYLSWFGTWPYGSDFYEKLREVPHPDVMAPKDKFYHVPTETRGDPGGELSGQLPANLEVGVPVHVDLAISDDLGRWDRDGRVHEVLLRVRIVEATELDRLSFKLNGTELPEGGMRRINRMYMMSAPRYRVFGQWYVFRLEREHWPAKGGNTVEVTLLERDPNVTPPAAVRDVELETRYLMGKSFHRGFVDPDLGPYEHRTT